MFSSFDISTFHPGKPQQLQVDLARVGQRRGWGTSLAALHHCCHPTKERKMTENDEVRESCHWCQNLKIQGFHLSPPPAWTLLNSGMSLQRVNFLMKILEAQHKIDFSAPPYPWQAWADWHDLALTNRISTRIETEGAPCCTIVVYDLKGIVELKQILEKPKHPLNWQDHWHNSLVKCILSTWSEDAYSQVHPG